MNSDNIDPLLCLIYDAGMQVTTSLPNPGGSMTYVLSQDQVKLGLEDQNELIANLNGITKAQAIAWQTDQFNVYCAGHTKTNRPCRNIVSGGSQVSAREYVQMQGALCQIHQDRSDY